MSSWGMNDGANLTGKQLWTNGDATVQDGGTGPNATYVTDNVQAGDVLVGADSKLYRVVSVTSETALEVDRNYEGGTADGEDILRMKLPRFVLEGEEENRRSAKPNDIRFSFLSKELRSPPSRLRILPLPTTTTTATTTTNIL